MLKFLPYNLENLLDKTKVKGCKTKLAWLLHQVGILIKIVNQACKKTLPTLLYTQISKLNTGNRKCIQTSIALSSQSPSIISTNLVSLNTNRMIVTKI